MIAALLLSVVVSANVPEIAAYRAVLRRAEAGEAGSIEALFEAATRVQATLPRVIEDLSREDYEELERSLHGLVLNRDEVLLAEPDAGFFLALAAKHGTPADVAFFENYKATFPESVWASYLEQQTDVTGCTLFGSGELVARYAGWRAYRAKYPDAYRAGVAARLADIEEEVTQSSCACGSREDVLRELRQFAAQFPDAPVAKRVRARIRELQRSKSNIRLHCMSG